MEEPISGLEEAKAKPYPIDTLPNKAFTPIGNAGATPDQPDNLTPFALARGGATAPMPDNASIGVDSLSKAPQVVPDYPATEEGTKQRVQAAFEGVREALSALQDAMKALQSFKTPDAPGGDDTAGAANAASKPEASGPAEKANEAEKAGEVEDAENEEQDLLKLLMLLINMLSNGNIPDKVKDDLKSLLPKLLQIPAFKDALGGAMGAMEGKPEQP